MKRKPFIGTLLALLCAINLLAQPVQYVTQLPEKPKTGEEVTIKYNALSEQATFKNVKEITLFILFHYSENFPVVKELKMTNENNVWSASFKLDKEVLFNYYFDDGANLEYNNDEVWYSLVYNAKSQPVSKANYMLGNFYEIGGFKEFKFKKSGDKSLDFWNKEIKANSTCVDAFNSKWSYLLSKNSGDNTLEMIKNELDEVYALVKSDEKAVNTLLPWFEITKQQGKANDLRNVFIKKNPKGYIAQMISIESVNNAFWKEHSPEKVIDYGKLTILDFPYLGQNDKDKIYLLMLRAYVGIADYESASELMKNWTTITCDTYNEMAWFLVSNDKALQTAVKWANEGMKLAENPDIENKPTYQSTKSWKEQMKISLATIADTYAFGLNKLGYTVAAEYAYQKCYDGNNEEINSRYVNCLVNNGNFSKADEVCEECVLKGKAGEDLLNNYKKTWIKLKGSEKGFNEKAKILNSKANMETKEKLKKEMVNKPAVDFTLKSLDGKTVKLSDFKGKIVVIDFWATWCGPCVASFPALQKITDKYKDNPNIVILAIDTKEDFKGDEQIIKVKEFIESKRYTFNVLIDDDMADKYQVNGIPTKFIVDRYGKIQFKTVGFNNEAKMLNEMEAQFEILMNDDYLKDLN